MSLQETPASAERPKPLIRGPIRADTMRLRTLTPVAALVAVAGFADPTPTSLALGLPTVLIGEAIRLWAAGYLHKTRELVTSGPYAHVRHPLYLGTLLIGVGLIVMAGAEVALVGLPAGLVFFFAYYLPYKDQGEAERLERRFGDAFRAYRDTVPALRPRLRPWRDPARPRARSWRPERLRDNSEISTALAVATATTLLVLAGGWLI